MALSSNNDSWKKVTESVLDYLNAKIPYVPEVTRQEIAVHLSSQMAIAVYDAYESWTRDFARAAKARRPVYRNTHLTEGESE